MYSVFTQIEMIVDFIVITRTYSIQNIINLKNCKIIYRA